MQARPYSPRMSLNRFNIPFIVVGVLLLLAFAMMFAPGRSHMILRNDSGERIPSITVRVDDKEVTYTDVPPDAVNEKFFLIWADSNYDVAVMRANGQALRQTDGYVTNGSRADATISVRTDRIDIGMAY
jgi:hypothetical protein